MNELALYSGALGGVLGSHLLGWRPIGYVEIDDYNQRLTRQRILDGAIPIAPIFGDVRAFTRDGFADAYRGVAQIVTAGFPCQPFSVAGSMQRGDDSRNLWPATADVLRIVRPPHVLLENVPGLCAAERLMLLVVQATGQTDFLDESAQVSRFRDRLIRRYVTARGRSYLGRVLGDMALLGYDARWRLLSASDVGASHKRTRLWIKGTVANSTSEQDHQRERSGLGAAPRAGRRLDPTPRPGRPNMADSDIERP